MCKIKVFALSAVLALVAATAAYAAVNFHNESFTDGGLFLSWTGRLAGLGNSFATDGGRIELSAGGTKITQCTNPAGNVAPGQTPPVTLTGVTPAGSCTLNSPGTFTCSVSTTGPTSPVSGAPDCPNRKWTETVTGVAFTSATIKIFATSTSTTPVATQSCGFSPATSDGAVPSNTVSCTPPFSP